MASSNDWRGRSSVTGGGSTRPAPAWARAAGSGAARGRVRADRLRVRRRANDACRVPPQAHCSAAATPAPARTATPASGRIYSSAVSSRSTLSRRLDSPIRPIRHTLPFIGPSPPPISMPNSASEPAPHARLVDAVRDRRRCSASTADAPPRRRARARARRARRPAPRDSAVAREARLEPLLVDEAQRLVQRVVHRDRRGVMVDALLAPVLLDHRQVEVPALHLRLAPAQRLDGARAEGDAATGRAGSERHFCVPL